jgi:hypothetical protein
LISDNKETKMRAIVLILLLLSVTGFAWNKTASGQDSTIIEYGTEVVSKALNFSQGDRESLVDAQDFFSPKGWEAFMKKLNGWLDEKGAPKYTSSFKQGERPPKVQAVEGGFVLTVFGDLKQQSRNEYGGVSTTTYSVAVDMTISNKPLQIELLEQRTCGKSPCD